MTTLGEAMQRLANDPDFADAVLRDPHRALAASGLTSEDIDRLVAIVHGSSSYSNFFGPSTDGGAPEAR
jgi:hypothetical protein